MVQFFVQVVDLQGGQYQKVQKAVQKRCRNGSRLRSELRRGKPASSDFGTASRRDKWLMAGARGTTGGENDGLKKTSTS